MTTRVVCPSCRAANEVPDDLLGRKIRCRRCDEVIATADRPEGVSDRPRRPRRADDYDDLPPARRRRRRRSRGLSPVGVFAASFAVLVLVIAGLIGAYFAFGRTPPTQPDGAPAAQNDPQRFFPPATDQFLMARQPQYESYFRKPEEPPTHALTFAEPQPEGAAGPGNVGPQPVHNPSGQLAPEVLQKIKESTVFVGVVSPHGQGSGSGFFAGESGFVVTNAHVVFMLQRGAPKPTSVKVIRNKGEKNEVTLAAQVVAVDPDADLAVLSVPKEGLPAPLPVKSALTLRETQPVYVAGFPLGEMPGKNVTIDHYDVSSLKKEHGELDKVQIHGDMVPGNSGGPVLDADGNVVAVCVSIARDARARMNFAVPGDKVLRLLNGRFAEMAVEAPARADGQLRVPVTIHVIDPLSRVRQAAVEYWVGPPGTSRPGSHTPPRPDPKDGPRQTLTLDLKQQTAHGELKLPPLPAGQAYWLQPSLSTPAGKVWMSAQVYHAPPPVERKPAKLAFQPAGDRSLVLDRWSSLTYTDPMRGGDHRALLALETKLTESPKGRQGDGWSLFRQFASFKEGVSVDGEAHMTTRVQYIGPNLSYLADNAVADVQGSTTRAEFDGKVQGAPLAARPSLISFQAETMRFLQALEVPMPGKEVQPGETWTATRPLPFDAGWKSLETFQRQVWAPVENEMVEVTYTYSGLRTAGGAERAVIQLKGQAGRGVDTGSTAAISGTALVDLATGQVVEEEVTTQARAELVVFNAAAVKAQGTVVARLRRE